MEFSKKIQELRNKAQETQAANKIMDMLTDLKLKNDETTSYRWVWELIQNAKDVVNSTGKVDILINFNKVERSIQFSHNGKLFSTENIVFLIEQVSTKDRKEKTESKSKITGKFGTGFLTTHLLSEKVNVSGYLKDNDENPLSFNVALDRSGENKEEIIRAIQESCMQLDKNTKICRQIIDENSFNTSFLYKLDDIGMKTASNGLNNLIITAPYVFTFVPEINSITVVSEDYRQVISRGEVLEKFEDGYVLQVYVQTNNKNNHFNQDKLIYTFGLDDISLAVEVEKRGNEKFITKYREQLPKIFCDFPLIGTNDFSFPVVLNSPLFNPTEPRNGIHLTDKDHKKILENKKLMLSAADLYCKLVQYFSEKDYKGLFNIVKFNEQPEKDWLSCDWYEEEIISDIKNFVKKVPLIFTQTNEKKSLFNEFDEPVILISKDSSKDLREEVWELTSKYASNRIPIKEELEYWYESLWEDCKNHELNAVREKVETYTKLDDLKHVINNDIFEWLNKLIALVYSKKNNFLDIIDSSPAIFPNQEGLFCSLDSVYLDCNIDEVYKDLALSIDFNVRSKLLNENIKTEALDKLKSYGLEDLFRDIENNLHSSFLDLDEFYKSVVTLISTPNVKQEQFLCLVNELYKEDSWNEIKVTKVSEKLLSKAIDYWVENICKEINSSKTLDIFTDMFNFDDIEQTVKWLSKFIDFIKRYNNEYLFDKFNILPNQYKVFKKITELYLDSGEIEETLKDASKFSGYDVRESLLLKDIFLSLPKNRTIYLEDISEKITKYVKENKNNLGQTNELIKETFNKIYLWLRSNAAEQHINKQFAELLSNLHWFYNDDDIAENISKVEKYNDVLAKFGVNGVNELEQLLEKSIVREVENPKVEISKELLAQWGISTEEELKRALVDNVINAEFLHNSESSLEMFNYVKTILERSKNNILKYLSDKGEYDVSDPIEISDTIFVIQKNNVDIYLITRPSDYDQIILYYQSEIDVLDYEKDCELWVEDGYTPPQKITFGKILKLTGVNKIPLRSIRYT